MVEVLIHNQNSHFKSLIILNKYLNYGGRESSTRCK